MGPVLLLAAINAISLLGDINLFADDTTMFSEGRTPYESGASVGAAFVRAAEWFRINKLCRMQIRFKRWSVA